MSKMSRTMSTDPMYVPIREKYPILPTAAIPPNGALVDDRKEVGLPNSVEELGAEVPK